MIHRRVALVVSIAAFTTLGCSDVTRVGPVTNEDGGDVVVDASAPDAVAVAPEDQLLPSPATLPLGPSDVLRISDGEEIDVMSAFVVRPDGSTVLAFDRSDTALTKASLLTSHSRDGRSFSRPTELTHGGAPLVANPSFVRHGETAYLYYTTAPSIDDGDGARSFRRLVGLHAFGEPEPVGRIPEANWLLSWPSFGARSDGRTVVAYRTTTGAARLATSTDGRSFGSSVAIPTATASAMPSAAELGTGQYAFSFQQGEMTSMVSYVTTSPDGLDWKTPDVVTSAPNVHDTSFARRGDGGLDLYYIYPSGFSGFRLFRRQLHVDGRLGPEQAVTTEALGEPSKPRATSLPDGRVLLAYAEIVKRAPADGAPVIQRIVLAALPGEAP